MMWPALHSTVPMRIGDELVLTGSRSLNENPSDLDDPVGYVCMGESEHAEAAADAAARAFPSWASQVPQARADVLYRCAALVGERRDWLAKLISCEAGKTWIDALAEVDRCAWILRFNAGEALRMSGQCMRSVRAGVDIIVRRDPIGPIAVISPWNFPLAIPAWKLAPALACGNSTILKPSELAPATGFALVELLRESGAPSGVVNCIQGEGPTVGAALVQSRLISAVSFTGSENAGREIIRRCADQGKRVQAEMGGKNPWVVLDDADLEVAVDCAVSAAFSSAGQRCTATSRIIVTPGIRTAFVEALRCRMTGLRVGHALDPATNVGPLISDRQLCRVVASLEAAGAAGASVYGGLRPAGDGRPRGHYLSPAIVLGLPSGHRLNQEEVFGPVASVLEADDFDDAIRLANDSRYGLSAGICTRSLHAAQEFMARCDAGIVTVNLPTAGIDYHVPFGGRKASSYGPREQGSEAMDFFSETKTCYLAA
jgi:aldehyde dehydrogenase (NAD+)